MIKWRQHLWFRPSLASLPGVTSYMQEALSCSRTCSRVPGTSLIRITGKKGTGLERLKINLSWSLLLQPWNSESHVKSDSGSLGSWIWASGILCGWPWAGAGWDLSTPLALAVCQVRQRRTLGFVFSCFILSSNRRGGGRRGVRTAALSTCRQRCACPGVAPAALESVVVGFVWVSPPSAAWPVWQWIPKF